MLLNLFLMMMISFSLSLSHTHTHSHCAVSLYNLEVIKVRGVDACLCKWVIAAVVLIGWTSCGEQRNWLDLLQQRIKEWIYWDLAARNPGKPQQGPLQSESLVVEVRNEGVNE